jgi:hypothetical protein
MPHSMKVKSPLLMVWILMDNWGYERQTHETIANNAMNCLLCENKDLK